MHLKLYRILFFPVFLLLTIALSSCSNKSLAPSLTVSIEPQRALLEKIVGNRYDVVAILSNGANPETFEPTVKARMAVDNSDIFFVIGNMPFESTIKSSLSQKVKVIDCSQGIQPIYGTHSHDESEHNHANIDPHIWASIKNARTIAATMLNAVIEIDPANADFYRHNFAELDSSLIATDKQFEARLADHKGAFAVWHPSLSYFARDYDLTQIAVGFENKDMSPKHLVEVTKQAQAAGVKVLFFQREFDSRQAQSLNEVLKARMITINPLAYNFINELSEIVDELTY